jgi:hypothetical protein
MKMLPESVSLIKTFIQMIMYFHATHDGADAMNHVREAGVR